jgi:hypothetical protein
MSARLLATLTGLLVLGISSVASAQIVCLPGQGCKVQVSPPPVTWKPPPVTVQPPPVTVQPPPVTVQPPPINWQPPPVNWQTPQVQVDPAAQAKLAWQIELERRARWEAYFSWRQDVWVSAQSLSRMQAQVDTFKYQARQTPDPLAFSSASYGLPINDHVSFPRGELGIIEVCYGVFSGSGSLMYVGYCPAVRFRFNSRWAVALDPAIVTTIFHRRSFGTFGLRPGVEYTFAQGRRSTAPSRGYAIAGLDLWLPTSGGETTPTAFLGAHLGLGAMIEGSQHFGFGFETSALIRGGVGNQDNARTAEMSTFRVGFEVRAPVLHLTFW